MTNMANNRTLGLGQTNTELKQLKDTTNLLDNKQQNLLQTTTTLPTHLPTNAAQLNLQATALAAQNSTLPLQATQLQQVQNALKQQTTNQLINNKETNNNQLKSIKLEPPILLNNNLTNLTNLSANLINNNNCLIDTKKEVNEVEDINIEDDEPTIEDEEIDAIDDLGNSEEDDSTTLKQKLKQQQRILLRRSAFSDPKSLTSQLAKLNNHINSSTISAALNQFVNKKKSMHSFTANVANLTNKEPISPNGSIKSPNSTASATTLPSGDDSPNSSFNSISIAGSLKKRRKYSTILSIDDILQKPNDV